MSAAGNARLFRDNFGGDGSRAHDFGYPRHSTADDPYPDPAQAGNEQPLVDETDTTAYAGGKTHRGCYTDVDKAQSVAALPVLAYTGTANTRAYCASLCTQQGYAIAGVETDKCYCGDALGAQTARVVTSSCETKCPGDASLCGNANRLSVLSSVDV